MLNFSSISLANTKVKFTLFTFAFAIAFFLYLPGMNGHPIWDDITYWFFDPVMEESFSYSLIWKNFTWPLSVSAQKFLYSVGGDHWNFYHGINFLLHSFNSWLVYTFLLQLGLKRNFAFFGFLFFLVQPASVISVAWMIQFKTLLCFSLAIGTLILFLKVQTTKDIALPAFLFLLSVVSKSSSLPLPLVLIFLLGKEWRSKKLLRVIPFLLISTFGLYRIFNSEIALEGIATATSIAKKGFVKKVAPDPQPVLEKKETTIQSSDPVVVRERRKKIPTPKEAPKIAIAQESFSPPPDEHLANFSADFAPEGVKYERQPETKRIIEPTMSLEALSPVVAYGRIVIKTLYYYFWQAYLPMDNAPVKGLNPFPPEFQDYLHILFLFILTMITWGTPFLPILLSAHAFLLPYLGIIPAPYMNVTWVSDQHLYLALPFFILLLLGLVQKIKSKWAALPLCFLVLFFSYQTRIASGFYRNNFSFYEKCIDANVNNIPLVYNLAILYIADGKGREAEQLLEAVLSLSEDEPYMKQNRFYPFLVQLYSRLRGNI